MTSDKILKINEVLKKLEITNNSIVGSAIVKRNGILIYSRLPKNIDERNFSAIAATIFGAIEAAAVSIESDTIHNLINILIRPINIYDGGVVDDDLHDILRDV